MQHLYELVNRGYYDGNRFFRVTRAYVQFGVNGDPKISSMWSTANLRDDPVKGSNTKGTVSYAKIGPNSRATQLFFNMRDNKDLAQQYDLPVDDSPCGRSAAVNDKGIVPQMPLELRRMPDHR